jgi:hypothetical protein
MASHRDSGCPKPFGGSVQNGGATCRLDAAWYFSWLRELDEWQTEIAWLRAAGSSDRRKGLPLREYAANEVEELGGDPSRSYRYAARARRLEAVLPPKLRFVAALVVDYRCTLEIEIEGSRALAQTDLPRLDKTVRRRLRRNGLTRAERDWLALRLKTLDPVSVRVLFPTTSSLGVGSVAAVNATVAAAGSWPAVASAAGCLPIGPVATVESERVAITHPFTFLKNI